MRRRALLLLPVIALAATAATAARAHSTPQIRAQKAHERQVLDEVNRIQVNLEGVVQQYDGAKLRLQRVETNLHRNEVALHVARNNFHAAQKRLMARLYSLYVYGKPSTLDVLAGSKSISELINRAESAQVLSNEDASLGRQALRFERTVQQRERRLKLLKQKRVDTVRWLANRKQTIQNSLGEQKRLLASIHTTIQRLVSQEAARERRQKLAAERRLQAQLAAQRQAASQAAATAQPSSSSSSDSDSLGTVQSPVTVPIGDPGVGHPEAAQIALHYLGVPYVWGGSTPSGFDCSGLVMDVYEQLGISLQHYTVAQWDATIPISSSQMEPGDLVFFDGLGHVGIYIGNGQFVDAPHTGSVVRIDSLAAWGGSFDGARRVP